MQYIHPKVVHNEYMLDSHTHIHTYYIHTAYIYTYILHTYKLLKLKEAISYSKGFVCDWYVVAMANDSIEPYLQIVEKKMTGPLAEFLFMGHLILRG